MSFGIYRLLVVSPDRQEGFRVFQKRQLASTGNVGPSKAVTRIYFRGGGVGGRHSIAGMAEARRAEEWVGFLERTRRASSPPARGLMERCKLPQWGPGRSPGRNRFWCISKLVEGIKSKRCVICFCVSNFSLKFRGCSNTQNTPLVTAWPP